jgi:L-ascorbate metabolism protein UlaG (beta-lactamase superfamily)
VGECVTVGAVRVQATPAIHDGFRPPFGPRAACLGFVLEGTQRVYFAGDTDLFDAMASLTPLDLALLPVWGWGPWLGPGHLDPYRAALALTLLRPAAAMPIHWGSLFPFGLGRWRHRYLTQPPRAFTAAARVLAPQVQVHVVEPGGRLDLRAPVPAP